MPTQEQVWTAADRVLARGEEPVSVASVLAELRRVPAPGQAPPIGGSERTAGPHVKTWKVARDYTPRAKVDDLPERLQDEHGRFIRAVWTAAMDEAEARIGDERRKLSAEAHANDILRVEAMVEAEAARATAVNLRTEVEALQNENATLRNEVVRLRERLDHVRSEEYWDKIMQEAYELMPPDGTLSAAQIMARLSRGSLRMGRSVRERLGEATLRKKIEVRAAAERYFERRGDDTYARLPGWDGPLGKKVRDA